MFASASDNQTGVGAQSTLIGNAANQYKVGRYVDLTATSVIHMHPPPHKVGRYLDLTTTSVIHMHPPPHKVGRYLDLTTTTGSGVDGASGLGFRV